MIQSERFGNVLVVRLDRPVTNAIGIELVAALTVTLNTTARADDVAGVVLSSTNEKFFSIGLDIPALFSLPRDEFARFLHEFNQLSLTLLTLPKPTVAAVRGHAIAGGCILALCCDYRIIGSGKKLMGLNEAKLGVPIPYVAYQALVQVIGARAARQVIDSASFYGPEELLRLGLVDSVVEIDGVERAAVSQTERLAEIPGYAYRHIKGDRLGPVVAEILDRLEDKERIFLDCWFAPQTQENLRQAMQKFQAS